jgi:hypothetical protein
MGVHSWMKHLKKLEVLRASWFEAFILLAICNQCLANSLSKSSPFSFDSLSNSFLASGFGFVGGVTPEP